jgi:hypothetical protein
MDDTKTPISDLKQKDSFAERLSNRGNFTYNKLASSAPAMDILEPKKNIPGDEEDLGTNQEQKKVKGWEEIRGQESSYSDEDKLPERSIRNDMKDTDEKRENEEKGLDWREQENEGGVDGEVLEEGQVKALDEDGNEITIEQPVKPKFPVFALTVAGVADFSNIILSIFGFTKLVQAMVELASSLATFGVSALFAATDFAIALGMLTFGLVLKIMSSGILFVWYRKGYITKLQKIGLKVARGLVKKLITKITAAKMVTIMGSSIPLVNLIPFQMIFVIITYNSGKKIFKKIIEAIGEFELMVGTGISEE